jgi:hypothetical protein
MRPGLNARGGTFARQRRHAFAPDKAKSASTKAPKGARALPLYTPCALARFGARRQCTRTQSHCAGWSVHD